MEIGAFKTDESLEISGVWVDIGDGAKLKVARAGNPQHDATIRRLRKPHEMRFRNGDIPTDIAATIAVEGMAKHILLDWEGITENGKPVPFTPENARRFLRLKDFRLLVAEIASNMETFRTEQIQEAAENLSTFPPVVAGVGTADRAAPAPDREGGTGRELGQPAIAAA